MRLSYQWLKDYVDIDLPVEELAELITRAGVEVDGIEATDKGMTGLVVAEVTDCVPHPDSDRLSLCQVTTDGSNRIQVVCGAPNVAQGQKVVFAQVGAELAGDSHIKATEIRGQASNGMICSMEELGIPEELVAPEDKGGIRVLPDDAPVGEDALAYLGLYDWIIELDLTPNRSDCLSVYNVAKEVAALLEKPIRPIQTELEEGEETADKITVSIQDPDLCHRFTATMVEGTENGRSPIWMEHRLQCAGMRPISSLVDVTNYVMLELGQPLHAYDYHTIAGPEILVRRAHADETIITLDGQNRDLSEDMLLICDADRAVGIAGVMGGEDTEIREDTKDVLIEAAYFEPRNLRRTSLDLGLKSEASLRNEKGLNMETVALAGARAAQLIRDISGGRILAGQVDVYPTVHPPRQASLNYAHCNEVLGTDIPSATMEAILVRLGFEVLEKTEADLLVQIPPHRPDVAIAEDLIEEVARVYGYDHIPESLPYGATTLGVLTDRQQMDRTIRRTLEGFGYREVVTYSMIAKRHRDLLRLDPEDPRAQAIPIQNPLSEEMAVMRTTNVPGMLLAAGRNFSHRQMNLAYFELATVFFQDGPITPSHLAIEKPVLSLMLTGKTPASWQSPGQAMDFYTMKGTLEGLFADLAIADVSYEALRDDPTWHPGRTAKILWQDHVLGVFGEIHPTVAKSYDLKQAVLVAEIDMDLLAQARGGIPQAQDIIRYPEVRRDFAFVLDEGVSAGQLKEAILGQAGPWFKDLQLFDVYQGQGVAEGKKSMAVEVVYQSHDGTLSDEEVNREVDRMVAHVSDTLDAKLRD